MHIKERKKKKTQWWWKPHKFENNTNWTGRTQQHPVIKSAEINAHTHTSKRMEVVFVLRCICFTDNSQTTIKYESEGERKKKGKTICENIKTSFGNQIAGQAIIYLYACIPCSCRRLERLENCKAAPKSKFLHFATNRRRECAFIITTVSW